MSFLANKDGWHGKAVPAEQEGAGDRGTRRDPRRSRHAAAARGLPRDRPGKLHATNRRRTYADGIATRKAFGETFAWLAGHRTDLVVLDGEVGNSTYTEDLEAVAPDRFIQLYIAEQSMVGVQTGLQALGKTAFAGARSVRS